MRRGVSRVTRAVVVSALVGAMGLGALTPSAGAALGNFSTSASGFALRVTVDMSGLPAAVKTQIDNAYATAWAALPAEARANVPSTFPFVIDQTFVKSASDATATTTKAVSLLGEGFKNLASKTAESVEQSGSADTQAQNFPDDPSLAVLQTTVGKLTANVSTGPKVDALATLAQVDATLLNVASMLPAELQGAFQTLVTNINNATATAETAVQGAVDTVESTIVGALPSEISSQLPAGVLNDLSAAIDLPTVPNPLTTNLATISKLTNKTAVERAADKASADAQSSIESVNVLNGFLSVGLINLASHSEAAGTAGSAKNSSSCSLADVRLGGLAGVSLDGTNLYVNVNGQSVAVPVVGDPTIQALKDQLTGVLQQAGISVKLCDAAKADAAPTGLSASNSVSAFVIEIAPKAPADIPALGITAGQQLVKITIDPTVQTAVNAAVAAPTQLPRTGAPAAVSAIMGLGLVGSALVVRRRFAR